MTEALEDHEGTVSTEGRTITNFLFAYDTDGLAGEEKLAKLVERLGKTSTAYGMEISAEKTNLMRVPSQPEILSRIAQATAALTRLKSVWNDRSISLSSNIQLMRSLVTIIFLYAWESWTLTEELQRKIQAIEMRCYCKILRISYKDHVTNEKVCANI